jgi:uncharacterized protein
MAKTVRGKKRQEKRKAVKAHKPLRLKKTTKLRAASLPKTRKQSTPSAPERAKLFVDCCELPLRYDRTAVALMARDPYWLYAYWEINSASLKAIKRKLGPRFKKSVYTLRMRDWTGDGTGTEAKRWFDIDVTPSAQSHYINLESDNVSYRADLGLRAPGGIFYSLARSNVVSTPCANVSDRCETTWMNVKHTVGEAPTIVEQTSALPCAPQLTVSQRKHFDVYGPKPLLNVETHGHASLREKTPNACQLPDEKTRCTELSNEIFSQSANGSSDMLQGNPSSLSLSQGASEHPGREREFFLEIGTDLIVYGRTQPGARVRLGDDPVAVREDGSFSARFALPDGTVPLHFVAKSNDGLSVRTITTSINRTPTLSD